jgi:hypothetical protein
MKVMKKIKLYDIEWEIDEVNLSGIRSHTGEKYGHLLAEAEDEQEALPSEMELEIDEESEAYIFDDLYWTIERAAEAFYCQCVGYQVEEQEDDDE